MSSAQAPAAVQPAAPAEDPRSYAFWLQTECPACQQCGRPAMKLVTDKDKKQTAMCLACFDGLTTRPARVDNVREARVLGCAKCPSSNAQFNIRDGYHLTHVCGACAAKAIRARANGPHPVTCATCGDVLGRTGIFDGPDQAAREEAIRTYPSRASEFLQRVENPQALSASELHGRAAGLLEATLREAYRARQLKTGDMWIEPGKEPAGVMCETCADKLPAKKRGLLVRVG